MRITKNIGLLLLSAFLILMGLSMAAELTFRGMHLVLGILAIAAGVCLLVEKWR